MNEIIVRRATADDRAACAAIYANVWPLAFPGFERVIDQVVFDAETDGEDVFVAVCAGLAVGFAAHYAPANFLHHLYVMPEAQRTGVGSALLRAVRLNAQPGLTLKVPPTNQNACAFYKAHGWTVRSEGEDAYGPWLLYGAPD